ncbi:myoD family inhibitor domain-containing protein 2 isoform X3 [Dendropsophus ebraccatus]|uniref:myoD family inhibitor domain-containing protein 2 isoform X3 n=1 Tax=Dendropsophus ebraccatus TaxID=150705 RepID=UPI00383176BF
MSETKANKSIVIFQNEQETIAWLAEEKNIASGSREDRSKSKEKLPQKHKPPPSPDTGDESFQENSHKKNMRLVTCSSNEECSKILSYKEAKQMTAQQTENEGTTTPQMKNNLIVTATATVTLTAEYSTCAKNQVNAWNSPWRFQKFVITEIEFTFLP